LASEISNLILVKDKDVYAVDDSITLNVKFSLNGEVRNAFNEKNWTDAYEKNDNQFKLKYGIKITSTGIRKHDVGKPIDTYRKASIFWTRNPKLVNPVKEKRIWVQVAKNFEPIIKLTEEDIQKELFDFDEPIILSASDFLPRGTNIPILKKMRKKCIHKKLKLKLIRDISTSIQNLLWQSMMVC